MKIEEWKETYGTKNPKKEVLEKIIVEIYATIVKKNKQYRKQIVEGRCLYDDCDKTYTKSTHALVMNGGPFCDYCIRYRKQDETKKLLKDHRPDVYNSIIQCDVDKDLLTVGAHVVATYRCEEKCSRCETQHEWSSKIIKRLHDSKFGNCPFCSGNRTCECIKEGEFRCYICKKIKDDKERGGGCTTRCRLCSRSMNDGDKKKMIHYIWRRTNSIMKRDPTKNGDLTEQHLHDKYDNQEGNCYISGIKMALGTFHNWQISVERVIQEGGQYSNANVVLICREFQSAFRQFSREVWDEMCALIMGIDDEIKEDDEQIDQMIREEIARPDYKLPHPPKPNHPTKRDDGTKFCKYCNEWKTQDEMGCWEKSNICKKCRKIRRDKEKSTFHGRIHYLYQTAKHGHIKRGLEFTITEQDIENIFLKQRGRCYYSKLPLGFSGQYQMSLERVDPTKGYIPENIALIILGLNATDCTRMKHEEDERDGSSGWNTEKLMWAISQNPRQIIPKVSSVIEVLEILKTERQQVLLNTI